MVNPTGEIQMEDIDIHHVPLDSMSGDPSIHESKEPELPVHRHLDFSNAKHPHDNFGSFVFHAPLAGTPAAQALEGNYVFIYFNVVFLRCYSCSQCCD